MISSIVFLFSCEITIKPNVLYKIDNLLGMNKLMSLDVLSIQNNSCLFKDTTAITKTLLQVINFNSYFN